MKRIICDSILVTTLLLVWSACSSVETKDSPRADISVRWKLITNFTGELDVFKAEFALHNNGKFDLNDRNWALFFNMAPRPILENQAPQPARVRHINGDWYKLLPEKGFRLKPGDSLRITYRGTEGVIKETDRPMGLYFVFYDENGKEEKIAEVQDFHMDPFTSEEQINRNAEDEEPIPTPEWLYGENEQVKKLPANQIARIIPTPVSLKEGNGVLQLGDDYQIYYEPGLQNEAAYFSKTLKELTGSDYKLTEGMKQGEKIIQLSFQDVRPGPLGGESYVLDISANGIRIGGSDAAGVFYGIQSLRSMIPAEDFRSGRAALSFPFLRVEDRPRFGFRGLHMDVSRNFQTKETVLRILDLLSFYKLNRFLLYTTEDEGWRIEIPGLPELTTVGARRVHASGKEEAVLHPAYGSGPFADSEGNHGTGYYSREDFIEILRYAKERHIKVIPELNFPGHARAAIKSMEARYQRLMNEGKEDEANEYRLIDPQDTSRYLSAQAYTDNVVSVARESTFRFYEKVVDEISKMYTEAGLVLDEFHAGGDEVPEGAWTASPMARELMNEHPEITDPKNLQVYFFRELLKRLKKRNLQVDGWEEVALLKNAKGSYDPNPEFVGQNVVPFIWNNLFDYPDLGYRLANAGYPVVLCNVSNFYFDLAYSKDPREPGLYWAGFVDTRDAWFFAPFDMYRTTLTTSMGRRIDPEKEYVKYARLRPDARKNILGLEAQLWSETIKGRDMIEYYMLPKLMGFAESAWAAERRWEVENDPRTRERQVAEDWNIFANTLGQRELPRLAYLNGGYAYRVPPPGAVIRNGMLQANVAYPGLVIRYTTDGVEPDENAKIYTGEVRVSGRVVLKAFDAAGGSSRSVVVNGEPER